MLNKKPASAVVRFIQQGLQQLLLLLIKGYRLFISPMLGPHCRFTPTCSEYAQQALHEYGLFRGILLTVKRLSRCHPWHIGGADPLPTCKHTVCDQPNHQAH